MLTRQYRQGSTTLILSISETNIPTTGSIRLMLDVQTPPDTDVVFPEVGNLVTSFSVLDRYSEPLQNLPNGKTLHRTVWQLAPGLPSETIFPALEVLAGTTPINTTPFPITVYSILPKGLETFEIKDIAAPVTRLPEQQQKRTRWLILTGFLMVVAFFGTVIVLARRPRKTIIVSPHEAAFQALENLPEQPLEQIHRLSEILLAFIGERFQLQTLGKTINEILPTLSQTIPQDRFQTLQQFLTEADQIRFSNRIPAGFAEDYEHYVRDFIDEMKQEEVPCD